MIRILINTDNVDTVCGEFCDDWTIQTDYWPCELAIWQIPEANSFPDGTIITATLNNEPVNQVQMGEVNFDPSMLDDPHGSTYARVCFTVQLPSCQPVTKCESINLGDCGLDGNPDGGRGITNPEHTNNHTETTFSINNPVSDVIRFSYPIEQGTAELYTMQGQRIKSFLLNGTSQLDVADLPSGTYLLSIAHSTGHDTKLVVVTH
ncbi:T9SS type A sorting domain-containing protein [Lewinella sp. LCG006]|uniref:T9SS type A sorting domain-containing protein n=1 Tax=Lewinella sp. LCG006 TaxID=3231911 RepID=UPI003461268A